MPDNNTIYIICAAVVAAVILLSVFIVMRNSNKVKKELEAGMESLNTERTALAQEREVFSLDQETLTKEKEEFTHNQESLRNAQLLFLQEKATKENLSEKSEKDISMDLFIKFTQMETLFELLKNNIASVDAKLNTVKDYSEALETMKNEVNTNVTALTEKVTAETQAVQTSLTEQVAGLKEQMTALQESYAKELSSIHEDMKTSLGNIEGNLKDIISNVTDSEMKRMAENVGTEVTALRSSVEGRMGALESKIKEEITRSMPASVTAADVEKSVRSVMDTYSLSTLTDQDVTRAITTGLAQLQVKEPEPLVVNDKEETKPEVQA